MDEEKIFGPLTLRQFLYVAVGFGLCYLVYNYTDTGYTVPLIVIIAGICLALIFNAPRIVIDENYIKMKKANSKSPEEFERWVRRKIAFLTMQIKMRKSKGLPVDPRLESGLMLFQSQLKSPSTDSKGIM